MVLALDANEKQRQPLSPVMYLSEAEGEEVLALLRAWFPASFASGPRQAGSRAQGGW